MIIISEDIYPILLRLKNSYAFKGEGFNWGLCRLADLILEVNDLIKFQDYMFHYLQNNYTDDFPLLPGDPSTEEGRVNRMKWLNDHIKLNSPFIELPKQAFNVLWVTDILTIDDVKEVGIDEISKWRGIGPKAINILKSMI